MSIEEIPREDFYALQYKHIPSYGQCPGCNNKEDTFNLDNETCELCGYGLIDPSTKITEEIREEPTVKNIITPDEDFIDEYDTPISAYQEFRKHGR